MKQAGLILAVLVGLVVLAAMRNQSTSSETEVTVESVTTGVLRSSVIASGSLNFRREVQLRSEVIGKVMELAVNEGDAVSQGQLLLQLDPESYRAEVKQTQANVSLQEIAIAKQQQEIANIEKRWARQQALRKTGSIGEEAFEAIDHSLKLARIDLTSRLHSLDQAKALRDKAEDLLSKTRIESPLAGIVTALDVKVGETVITGTTNIVGSSLMTIAAPEDIIAMVYVNEADIANLELAQDAEIFAVAYPNTAIKGTVEAIGSTARQYPGRDGRSFEVKVRLDARPDVNLFSGMSCRAEIFRESSANLIAVPIEAVLFEETDEESELKEQAYVFLSDNGDAKKTLVELGASSDDRQVISAGLAIGQSLITGPYRKLKKLEEGDKVISDE